MLVLHARNRWHTSQNLGLYLYLCFLFPLGCIYAYLKNHFMFPSWITGGTIEASIQYAEITLAGLSKSAQAVKGRHIVLWP